MLVSQWQLQSIVDEIETSIQRSINIMDETGSIIASTDKSRLGQIHQGALKVIAENLDMLTIHSDSLYQGSLPGVNLPILFKEKIVGVVGITGQPDEVAIFGRVIKQMTELLIANAYQQQRRKEKEDEKSLFLYQWLFNQQLSQDEESLQSQGLLLNIDITLPRAAIVLKLEQSDSRLLKKLLSFIDGRCPWAEGHISLLNGDQLILFYHSPSGVLPEKLFPEIKTSVEKFLQMTVAIGIGAFSQNRRGLMESLRQAKAAALLSAKSKGYPIRCYNDVDISFLLQAATPRSKKHFLNALFPDTDADSLKAYMEFLSCFFDSNGSISLIAEKLYIHKNTVQYKIKKLKSLTGYDPRLLSEAPTLYVAMVLYEEEFGQLPFTK